ncbi:MAG: hypothetical protein ACPGU1_23160 [Myxococcota bacterium]
MRPSTTSRLSRWLTCLALFASVGVLCPACDGAGDDLETSQLPLGSNWEEGVDPPDGEDGHSTPCIIQKPVDNPKKKPEGKDEAPSAGGFEAPDEGPSHDDAHADKA